MTKEHAGGPKHMPYVSASSFVIGLSAIGAGCWLEPDEDLECFLAEKQRLLDTESSALVAWLEGFTPEQLALDGIADKNSALIAYLTSLIDRRSADALAR
jgi:hypothetical protein